MILLSTPTSMRQWPPLPLRTAASSPTRQGATPVAGHHCGTLLFPLPNMFGRATFFLGGGRSGGLMFGWMMLDCGAHRRGMWLRGRRRRREERRWIAEVRVSFARISCNSGDAQEVSRFARISMSFRNFACFSLCRSVDEMGNWIQEIADCWSLGTACNAIWVEVSLWQRLQFYSTISMFLSISALIAHYIRYQK
jgi:hypothetical protein